MAAWLAVEAYLVSY